MNKQVFLRVYRDPENNINAAEVVTVKGVLPLGVAEIRRVFIEDTERVKPAESDQEAFERNERIMSESTAVVERLRPIVSKPHEEQEEVEHLTVTWGGDFSERDVRLHSWPAVKRGPDGQGGQHVGTSYGVLAEHVPTGICAIWTSERSQINNRLKAVDQLKAALEAITRESEPDRKARIEKFYLNGTATP